MVNLVSDISISAGSRMSCQELVLDVAVENLCTGIVKLPETERLTGPDKGTWRYLATYGKQSLAEDRLGLAIFYHQDSFVQMTEDAHSHVVVLKPDNGRLGYLFAAAWEQEPNGFASKEQFVRYLEETVQRLEQPIHIKF